MKPTNSFECVLLVRKNDDSPTCADFAGILAMFDSDTNLIPIEVQGANYSATGFMTFKAADEKLHFFYCEDSAFYQKVFNIINGNARLSPDDKYTLIGVNTLICSTIPQ